MLQYYCGPISNLNLLSKTKGMNDTTQTSSSSSFHLNDIVNVCYDEEWNIDNNNVSKPSVQSSSSSTATTFPITTSTDIIATTAVTTTSVAASTKLYSYYARCYVAGGASSCIRWVLNPLDLIKTRMQVYSTSPTSSSCSPIPTYCHVGNHQQRHYATAAASNTSKNAEYSNVLRGFRTIVNESGFRGLYQGLGPNAIAYALQTSIKYGTYELLKDQVLPQALSTDYCMSHKSLIYVASAAIAEGIADIFMCPFEMIKVKMQTATISTSKSSSFPSGSTIKAFQYMIQHRHEYGFPFGSLLPLWFRQVPGTIVNFYTYEHTTQYLYKNYFGTMNNNDTDEVSLSSLNNNTKRLLVTIMSGYTAGFCSSIISHPADTIVSLMNQTKYRNTSIYNIIKQYGIKSLLTKGLGPRIFINSNVICCQWALYDTFKRILINE